MRKKREMPHWAAFIVCEVTETRQISASFLAFWAQNRYQAGRAIEGMLPDNPKFVDDGGKLRPFTVLALQQCRPDETQKYASAYYREFSAVTGIPIEGLEPLI